jgi:hypothetical protein
MQKKKVILLFLIAGIAIVFFSSITLVPESISVVKVINNTNICPGQYGTPCSPEYLAELAKTSTFYEVDE